MSLHLVCRKSILLYPKNKGKGLNLLFYYNKYLNFTICCTMKLRIHLPLANCLVFPLDFKETPIKIGWIPRVGIKMHDGKGPKLPL